MKKLTDVCDIVYGYAFDSKRFSSNKGTPVIRIRDVVRGYTETFTDEEVPSEYFIENGDLLIGMDGEFNIGSWNGGHALLNQRVCKLIPGNNVSNRYLYHFMPHILKEIEANTSFVTVKHLSAKHLNAIDFPEISPEEQKKIAAHLDTIQAAIDNKKQQLSHLDELVKSRFVEMFGDPITNSKNFHTKKVIDVVTLQRGYDLPIQDRDTTGNIPVFGSNGKLGTHSVAKLNKGIVTGRSGTIGEVYICDEPFLPLNTTLFSNDTHGNNLIYLKYLLDFFDLKRFKSGVGVPTLNRNEFHGEQIIDVPIDFQNTFASYVQKIDSAKAIIKNQLADLQELLDSKMDEYFGE